VNAAQRYAEISALTDEVRALQSAMVAAVAARQDLLTRVHPRHARSAANLVHYVELRRHDIRELQHRLGQLGLSSLGRSEAHVLATVDAVLEALDALAGNARSHETSASVGFGEGDFLLAANAVDLLGPHAPGRAARIMVTLPSEAAHEPDLVDALVDAGMDIARINCAHDSAEDWLAMITNLRSECDVDPPLVAMDLAGPKLRTGPLSAGPAVVRARPQRDPYGHVITPARIWLTGPPAVVPGETPAGNHPTPALDDAAVPLHVDDLSWLQRRLPGDVVEVIDARGSRRRWTVCEIDEAGCLLSCTKTTYFANGLELTCSDEFSDDVAVVSGIPPSARSVRVMTGDRIVLTRDLDGPLVSPEDVDASRRGTTVAVGCTLPELFDAARPGQPIWFDDGKIGGIIEHVEHDRLRVEVTDVPPGGVRLKSGKGINVPDTVLPIDALTETDLVDLDFVATHADIVNLSFVREAADVHRLREELDARGADDIGIVLKIENVRAFENLPQLLLAAMESERIGVMIARGDLAVEVGFERLAEVQEEIMWACEAAHVPVIWATQVLESMARTGRPSRAEVTDAAMSVRAECVMLNKGPHILEAMAALDSILSRMGEHQLKKRSMLRELTSWALPRSF
jgi:pyruvate kinase